MVAFFFLASLAQGIDLKPFEIPGSSNMKMWKKQIVWVNKQLAHIHVFILSINKIIYQTSMFSRPHYSLGNQEDKYDTRPSHL